ncbi:MAG: hypothetical protein ABL893_21375, partial [Hyphomicrobium sp.]
MLSAQLLLPKSSSTRIVANMASCVLWGNDVAILGSVTQWTVDGTGGYKHHSQYWVLILDGAGVPKWERLFDIPTDFPIALDLGFVVGGNDLVFSATDGRETDFL